MPSPHPTVCFDARSVENIHSDIDVLKMIMRVGSKSTSHSSHRSQGLGKPRDRGPDLLQRTRRARPSNRVR